MRMIIATLFVFALLPGLAHSDAFDDCVDKSWEDYFECSADCGSDLKCQAKCSAKKVKDLKACDGKGVKRHRMPTGEFVTPLKSNKSADGCTVDRHSSGTALLLTLSNECREPQAVTIQWVSVNGQTENVTYNVGVLGRWVQFRGSGYNVHPTVNVEPMKAVLGGNATTMITPHRNEDYSCPVLFYFNGSIDTYIAVTFEIGVKGLQPFRQNTVLPPGKDVPVFSSCNDWVPTTIGAQLDPK